VSQIHTSICAKAFLGAPIHITIGGGIIHSGEVVQRSFGIRLDGFSTLIPAQRANFAVFLLQKIQ
jgi:hypothetical protein